MSMKQLLIMAIVRHLRASDYCEKNDGIYNNGGKVDRFVERGL